MKTIELQKTYYIEEKTKSFISSTKNKLLISTTEWQEIELIGEKLEIICFSTEIFETHFIHKFKSKCGKKLEFYVRKNNVYKLNIHEKFEW